jgi:hypothetical protein
MRDSGIVEAPHEPNSGTGILPVRFGFASHGRAARATTALKLQNQPRNLPFELERRVVFADGRV